jgi:hypothetical protein
MSKASNCKGKAEIRYYSVYILSLPIQVAAWSTVWVCGPSLVGMGVQILLGAWMSVSCECCVLSGRGVCVGLITRPEKSYEVWCV